MSATYLEIAPQQQLAPFIECVWTREVAADYRERVLPDGCVDILFSRPRRGPLAAEVVGAMTRPHLVPLEAGTTLLGIRFHPGMAAWFGGDLAAIQDRNVPLESVWPSAPSGLLRDVANGVSVERAIEILEDRLLHRGPLSPVQQAIGELVGTRGRLSIEDLAVVAGLGERQLRRTCLRQTGLAPKQLARILRFRHAAGRLESGTESLVDVAAVCGYADQAHMNRDFRALAGLSPGRFRRPRNG